MVESCKIVRPHTHCSSNGDRGPCPELAVCSCAFPLRAGRPSCARQLCAAHAARDSEGRVACPSHARLSARQAARAGGAQA